ncbi:MAG TPA: TerB family tellurite resistance protein [Rubrivivax sp.]|nr:TerB family tellurite resistance protein [Rubrivivax sp.]
MKDLLGSLLPTPGDTAAGGSSKHQLQLATAVLLIEVMRADTALADSEREAVIAALQREFTTLTADEMQQLMTLAHERSRGATDFHAFTSALNDHFSEEQKLRVVEAMWQVAYADGHLEAHEQHVLWRVADLLHVPHGAYIAAKMKAKGGAQQHE